MKVKNLVRRVVALGSGLSLVGATLFGAAAADLGDYPSPLFVRDGVFDGLIVVGDDAAASDVIGSIDIATALQAESVESRQVDVGGAGLVASGDAVEFSDPSDLLEVGENLGDVRETLTEEDLQA